MPAILTARTIFAFRMQRHGLDDARTGDPAQLAAQMCGAQAQLQSEATLQLWARNHQLTREAIDQALWRDRTLVKTSAMRQTLHLLPAQDYPIYISALKKSRTDALFKIMKKFGITRKQLDALNMLIVEALKNGPQTSAALLEAIRPKISAQLKAYLERAWSIQLFRLALVEGLISYAEDARNKPTFVLTADWLPGVASVPASRAQRLLLQRYLRAYSPATPADFGKWSGMPAREVRVLWHANRDLLHEISSEFGPASVLKSDRDRLAQIPSVGDSLRLLPRFDPFLLGHSDKSQLVPRRQIKRVYRSAGWISPVLLYEGRVAGVWSHKQKGEKVALTVEPFASLSAKMGAALDREIAALETFWNATIQLTVRT